MSIFISYRRSPVTDAITGQLERALEEQLGADVYRDVEDIPVGVKFKDHLQRALTTCSAGLIVVDPNWRPERLRAPEDFVRMEAEQILGRQVPLALVLLGDAALPRADEIPSSLCPLLDQPVFRLRSGKEFDAGLAPLRQYLSGHLPRRRGPPGLRVAVTAGVLLATGAAGAFAWHRHVDSKGTASPGKDAELVSPAATSAVPAAPSAAEPPASADPEAPTAEPRPIDAAPAPPVQVATRALTVADGAGPKGEVDPRCTGLACDYGRCTAVDDGGSYRCVATSEADCKSAIMCGDGGYCTFRNHQCVAGSDADCAPSLACRSVGHCSAQDGHCHATSKKQCEDSEACKASAHCSLGDKGSCIIGSEADCVQSGICSARGECHLGERGRCEVQSNKDCRQSEICRRDARCTFENGRCVIRSEAECRRSELCKAKGRCTFKQDSCVATSDKDCAKSAECDTQGRCALGFGGCNRPPPPSDATAAAVDDESPSQAKAEKKMGDNNDSEATTSQAQPKKDKSKKDKSKKSKSKKSKKDKKKDEKQ